MIQIKAFNTDSNSSGESLVNSAPKLQTQEALEAYLFRDYNHALKLQRDGKCRESLRVLEKLYESKLLCDKHGTSNVKRCSTSHLSRLYYSVLKNCGNIHHSLKEFDKAIDFYLNASSVDSTDIVLWYRLGYCALSTNDYILARDAFYQALHINPYFWPCLNAIINVLFVLGSFDDCLRHIAKALQSEPACLLALTVKKEIYRIRPFLVDSSEELFKAIKKVDVTNEQFEIEICPLRMKRSELLIISQSTVPVPSVSFGDKLSLMSYKNVACHLSVLYDRISCNPALYFGSPVNLSGLVYNTATPDVVEEEMDEDVDKAPGLVTEEATRGAGVKRRSVRNICRQSADVAPPEADDQTESVDLITQITDLLPVGMRCAGCPDIDLREPCASKRPSTIDTPLADQILDMTSMLKRLSDRSVSIIRIITEFICFIGQHKGYKWLV